MARRLIRKKADNPRGLQELEPDSRLPKGHLSVSALGMYQRCGKQYEFRYINGLKEPPPVALVEGSTHHEWLEATNKKFVATKRHLKLAEARQTFVDRWSTKHKEIEDWSEDSYESVQERGLVLVERYMREFSGSFRPTQAEERFELLVGGVPFLGFIDFRDRNRVLDYKVVKRAKSAKDVESSLQLAIYNKATGTKRAGFVSLAKQKQTVVPVIGEVDQNLKANLGEIAHSVAESIGKGAFPMADPGNWACSARFCGFWKFCRGSKKRKRK